MLTALSKDPAVVTWAAAAGSNCHGRRALSVTLLPIVCAILTSLQEAAIVVKKLLGTPGCD